MVVANKHQRAMRIELLALSMYTHEAGFRDVNAALRQHGEQGIGPSAENELFARAATDALSRLPDYKGFVVRGQHRHHWTPLNRDAALARYVPGTVVTEHAFVSSGVESPYEAGLQFVILSKHGKEVTPISVNTDTDGREVIFKPGSQFRVLAVADGEDRAGVTKLYAVMEEIE